MEKFIVSARKYRPQTFGLVVGQAHITTTLKNAILHNTLAHAFLFCGPRGVGKTTCARILAKTINCENLQPDGEACNECPSCVSFNNSSSLNIHELDAASNSSVDDMRELVTQIRFAPQEGKYKIYIIDEVHMLSQFAFNAFLKTLEEPPPYAKFILATTEKHKILPTILSRCQIFEFKRITNADTVVHLQEIAEKEHINAEKAALQLIAQKSEGCMRDALSILDKIVSFTSGTLTYHNTLEHLNLLDEDHFFKLLEAVKAQDVAAALLQYDQINQAGFEGNTLLEGFAGFLRNLMVSKDPRAAALLDVLEGMQEKYASVAQATSASFLVSALNVVAEAAMRFRDAQNKRLHVELCLIKLCYLQQALELMTDGGGQVVKKRSIQQPVAIKQKPVAAALLPKKENAEAVLEIENPAKNRPTVTYTGEPPAAPVPATPAVKKEAPPATAVKPATVIDPATAASAMPATKANLLDKLKQKVNADKQGAAGLEVREPILEEVTSLWQAHYEKVKELMKHSTVTSMGMATVAVDGLAVVITSATTLNQKLIEQEATELTEAMRKHFNNPAIHLRMEVSANAQASNKEVEPRFLPIAERYRMMVEHYPLVKELKEKLKLDLGY